MKLNFRHIDEWFIAMENPRIRLCRSVMRRIFDVDNKPFELDVRFINPRKKGFKKINLKLDGIWYWTYKEPFTFDWVSVFAGVAIDKLLLDHIPNAISPLSDSTEMYSIWVKVTQKNF